ncbi:MAG: hypothetical protein IPH43_14390 [Xanthomonadales bacterium]|nr:hypothetical protein [Xanthomonadales bacterium]
MAKITDLEKPAGALTLKAQNITHGDMHFDTCWSKAMATGNHIRPA